MRNLFLLLILAASIKAHAQVGLNVSVISPPIWETVNIGRSQYYKNTTKNGLSAGLELDNLFAREKGTLKLHFSIGAYYTAQSFTGSLRDTSTTVYNNFGYKTTNNYVSQINTRIINIPIMVRGSFKISELIENNRVGFELGIVTTTFLRYNLTEVAATTYDSAQQSVYPQTPYYDGGSLIKGLGSKFDFKLVGGIFVYVNRFYLSARFDIISLSNMYSNHLANVPASYSLYEYSATQGRMKDSFVNLIVSYRITRK